MNHRWKTFALVASLALATAAPPAAAVPPTPTVPAAARPTTATFTLVTGDRVTVTSQAGKRDRVGFAAAAGDRSSSFVTSYTGGHTIVLPSAAAADVRAGRLDLSLFDITALRADGRDDAHSRSVPVIVEYAGAQKTALRGTTNSRALTSIDARAAVVDKAKTRDFWASIAPKGRVATSIRRVTLDRRVRASTDWSVPQIGAPAAWQRGFTGNGVKIAVLDTGIDTGHPDFQGRIGASANFSDAKDTIDHFGHGTHVASIAAGDGAASGGKYKGVAPDATLLNGKVLDDDGFGSMSAVIAGMEWAVQQGAAVVNLSLGGSDPSDGTDEVSAALNRLSQSSGTLFVVAAGNCAGPAPAHVTSPAAADEALAVGNLTRDGSLNPTSCRGPRIRDGVLKPEISAPGTDIVAARAAGTDLGTPVDEHYTSLSGTSMATPHVAGVAALIEQAHPDWKAGQLKARLMSTADPQGAAVGEEGAGRVDADQATDTSVSVDAGKLEFGALKWPHPSEDTVTRTLTYHNPTTAPVTLNLAATMEPAAAAPKLSANELVVPAGSEASVTVTADRLAAGAGTFSGRITATAAGADPLVTAFGWSTEPELYDLTIRGIAKDGQPANGLLSGARLDGPQPQESPDDLVLRNGTATLRLPPGKYVFEAAFLQDATDTTIGGFTLASTGELQLSAPQTVTLDGRKAQPVEQSALGHNELMPSGSSVSYLINVPGALGAGFQISTPTGNPQLALAVPGGAVTTAKSEFAMHSRLEVPPYRARAAGAELEVRDLLGGPRFTGTKRLVPVDGGTAQPGELTGVRGKLALLAWKDSDERPIGDLVKAAQDAGAAAAMMYNPDRPGVEGLSGFWVYLGTEKVTIPALRISRATAQTLIGQAQPVDVVGIANTPYVYDLMESTQGQIPAKTRSVVTPAQLATVRETFGADVTGTETSEERTGTTPGGTTLGNYYLRTFPVPSTRTSYVQANSTAWGSDVFYNNAAGPVQSAVSLPRTYRAGERVTERWMAPVLTSGIQNGEYLDGGHVGWVGDYFNFQVSPYLHEQEFSGAVSNDGSKVVVERNGKEIGSADDTALWAEIPDDAARFKATVTAVRDVAFWKFSPTVKSTWTWTSKGGKDEVMPIITPGIDLPTADWLGRVPTGQPVPLALSLRHQAGSTASRFTDATLELSYDGSAWTPVPLHRTGDGTYTATITHLSSTAGQSPSLRLTAQDAAGNTVNQQITKAYGLK
ncbi:S8 family peptidase [Kribbella sp. WER1]